MKKFKNKYIFFLSAKKANNDFQGDFLGYTGITFKNLKEVLKPIIHWRNPIRGKFYYLKGLRRRRVERSLEKTWQIKKPLLSENSIFTPSRVIKKEEVNKIFYPSEVIYASEKRVLQNNHKTF